MKSNDELILDYWDAVLEDVCGLTNSRRIGSDGIRDVYVPSDKFSKYSLTKNQIINIRKWIEALRSGDYEQGEGFLISVHLDNDTDTMYENFSYCCMGVYAEINDYPIVPYIRSSGILNDVMVQASAIEISAFATGSQAYLDEETFYAETGISKETQVLLSGMNDDSVEFAVIARYLEMYIENAYHEIGRMPANLFDDNDQ